MDRQISRRTTIKAAVLLAVSVFGSFPINAVIAQTPKRIRYGVHTPEGVQMLRIYANAVRDMENPTKIAESDPRSWLFQWYTHAVRPDRLRSEEINRIYNNSAESAMAQAMWDTCEAHMDSDRENFFLPWHRMYLTYFEEIVRQVSGEKDFTLPYWDYTNSEHSALPAEFRRPNDPVWGVLYRSHRNKHVNDGKPIDEPDGAYRINIDAMKSNNYEAKDGDAGFCFNLDQGLHGGIHVDVGDAEGMGRVEWAARDPIFWVHHCNIDRIWASWARAGGKFPSDSHFLEEEFNFFREGQAVKAKVKDFMELTQYEYSEYLLRPAGSLSFDEGPQLVAEGWRFDSADKVKLGDEKTIVKLMPAIRRKNGGPLPAAGVDLTTLPSEVSLFLRLEGLHATGPTNTIFDVHVGASSQKSERTAMSFVGSINFFGATNGVHKMKPSKGPGRIVSFILSQEARQLLNGSPGGVQITFVPRGEKVQESPEVDRVSLVAR